MARHGIISTREDVGVQPIALIGQSIIGLVGTAPDAMDADFPLNEVKKIDNRNQAPSSKLGMSGTLPVALNNIFRQGQCTVQMIRVAEGTARAAVAATASPIDAALNTNTDWDAFNNLGTLTGKHFAVVTDTADGKKYLAFKNLVTADNTEITRWRPGQQITIKADGTATVLQTYTVQANYDSSNSRIEINPGAATTGLSGAAAYDIEATALDAITADEVTLQNMLGSEADGTGAYALLSADPKPKIYCTGWAGATRRYGGNANALQAALVEIAEKARGTAVLSGPGTNDGDAIILAGDFDSDVGAAYMVEPFIITNDGTHPADAAVAGKIAVNDAQNGFWTSPSNMAIEGALGLSRKISHGFANSQADILNQNLIAAMIRDGGIRLWGNETLSPTTPSYRFINVARVANSIQDSLDRALKWAVDKNITVRLLDQVSQSVNLFLATLTAQGAISGGFCYPDAEKNVVSTVKEGQVFFNVEWSAVYPMQTLNLSLQLSDRFLEAVLAEL